MWQCYNLDDKPAEEGQKPTFAQSMKKSSMKPRRQAEIDNQFKEAIKAKMIEGNHHGNTVSIN